MKKKKYEECAVIVIRFSSVTQSECWNGTMVMLHSFSVSGSIVSSAMMLWWAALGFAFVVVDYQIQT